MMSLKTTGFHGGQLIVAKSTSLLLFLCTAYLLSNGCVSVENVTIDANKVRAYDCDQLEAELIYVGAIADDAEEEQGVTGTNVAAATFVPFGLQINQMRAAGAEEQAEEALNILYSVWDEKNCGQEIYERNKSTSN